MAKPSTKKHLTRLKRAYDGRFDDVSAAVLVVAPPDGRIVSVNVEAEELTGYEKRELDTMTLADIFHEDHRRRIAALLESTNLDFRKLFEHSVIVRKRSRRKILVDMGFRRSRRLGEDAFIFTLQDITDLKNNEERVVRAHEYVSNIINSIVEVLLVISEPGEILTVNAAALQLLGYGEDELVGKPLATVLAEDDAATALAGDDLAEVETRLRAKDGRLIPVLASKSELRSRRSSDAARAVIVAMDISERKKAERLIGEQQQMIVQASKMSALGEMASSIAHEINNPLQVILGRCELLEVQSADPAAGADMLESVGLIDRMSQRIHKIIRGLQSLSRDQRHDAMEDAELSEIVKETLALCEQRIRLGVDSFVVPELDPSLRLHCRPTQISQVLLNLLNNSYDEVQGKPNAWIRLEAYAEGGVVNLAVSDSGGGVPEAVAAKIFTPFFTTKPVGKGTGLGLSVSKSLIEAHGGTLTLDRDSRHTRFVVRLPAAAGLRQPA